MKSITTGVNLLITGGSGLLGSELTKVFQDYNLFTPTLNNFNILNENQISNYIIDNNINLIIHTAAHTDLEEAEKNNEIAQKTNVEGTENICKSIQKKNIKIVYISSTGIYGNKKKTPYVESDTPFPSSFHHKTKFEAEQIVKKYSKNYLIIRTGWLFGGSIKNKKNFVSNRINESHGKKIIYANAIQKGNPTCVIDLSNQIKLLIKKNIRGTFNVVNKKSVSRLEYIKYIHKFFKSDTEILPLKTKYKRLAKVSDNEMAINQNLIDNGIDIMPIFTDSLKKYISKIKKEKNE